MKTLSLAVRLLSAAAAVAITLMLLDTVFAIAEPQRSILIARMQQSEPLPAAPVALALASNGTAHGAR